MLLFWSELIHNLYVKVIKWWFATPEEIIYSFSIKGIKPAGLLDILQEMVKRSSLIPIESIFDKSYYQKPIWSISNLFSLIPSSSTPPPLQSQLISLPYLNSLLLNLHSIEWQLSSPPPLDSLLLAISSIPVSKSEFPILFQHLQLSPNQVKVIFLKLTKIGLFCCFSESAANSVQNRRTGLKSAGAEGQCKNGGQEGRQDYGCKMD